MAKKEVKNGEVLGKISTIRDILMGQQMSEYDSRFQDLEEQIKQTESRINQQMVKMQENADNRFNDLENSLKQYIGELGNQINHVSDQERLKLGQLFAELSNQLLKDK